MTNAKATAKKVPPRAVQTPLEQLREKVGRRVLLPLARDYHLRDLLAVWDLVEITTYRGTVLRESRPPLGSSRGREIQALVEKVWRHYRVAPESVRRLLGPAFPVQDVVDRAINLGLAYPDGTIHRDVEAWILAAAEDRDLLKNYAKSSESDG